MVQAFLIPHILVPPIWGLGSHIYFNSFDGEHLFKVVVIILSKLVKAVSRSFGGDFQPGTEFGVCNFFPCMSISLLDILGQVWYLMVSTPDLCTLTYFLETPKPSDPIAITCLVDG